MDATKLTGRMEWVAAIALTMVWPAWAAAPQSVVPEATQVVGQSAGRGTGAAVPQPQSGASKPAGTAKPGPATAPLPVVPSDYVIGPDDVLTISLWKDPAVNGDATVRPDGKISFVFLNEIQAAGLTPEQLRASLTTAFSTYQQDPTVTLVVKQINSRKVYITGEVGRAGTYALTEHMTVLNLISIAGGVSAYAHKDNITVMRLVNGVTVRVAKVNYDDIIDGKAAALKQNIELKPGDQVIVP
ncbi:MAG TPA: polysaccharide biosynthesis/export family protein [Vicinamibacterales bacterium]